LSGSSEAVTLLLAFRAVVFAASVGLLVGAAFRLTRRRHWLTPLAAVTAAIVMVHCAQILLWPSAVRLSVVVQCSLLAVGAAGALVLFLFNRGRRELSPWLLALALIAVPLENVVAGEEARVAARVFTLLFFSMSLICVVLEDQRLRRRQIAVINAVSEAISEARDNAGMLPAVLEEFRRAAGSNAVWLRLFLRDEAVLQHSIGVSDHFTLVRRVVDLNSAYGSQIRQLSAPAILQASRADSATRGDLERENLDHVLVIPVRGRSATLGMIGLGYSRRRGYTRDEAEFFSGMARHVGVAIERLRLLQSVMRSQRDWVSVIDSLKDMVFVHDKEFRLVRLNRVMQRRIGRSYHEMVERSCHDVLPRSEGAQWQRCPYCETSAAVAQGEDPCFGGKTLVSTSAYTDEVAGMQATVHVIHDASDRYASEERYRRLFEQVQEGVFTSTPDGRLLDCNHAFARMLGYENREELFRLDIARDLYASPWQRERFCRAISENNYLRNYEIVLRRKDGSLLTALESSFSVRGRDGEIETYQGFLLDVSDKKHAEEEIRRRNRELQAVNAVAIIATQSFDVDEVASGALAQAVDLFTADVAAIYLREAGAASLLRRASYGYRSEHAARATIDVPEEFLGKDDKERNEVYTHRDLLSAPQQIKSIIEEESLRGWVCAAMRSRDKVVGMLMMGWRSEREVSSTDQSLIVAISRQLATSLEKIHLYHETRRAYDDLRQTQEQLMQSEKMSAVGQLVSGVAHELNNPLTAILGYAQLLEGEGLGERGSDYVAKLQRQAQRTQRLVQNLLSFARRRKPSKSLVDPRHIVDDTLALRDYDLRLHNIQVERDFATDVPGVIADAHQLEQVFLNIINNAVDAMLQTPGGGVFRVRIASQGERVLLEFHDSGPGLTEPSRVFDPFYTTKPLGKGTGLGLSICYGILKEHGGEIIAANHPDGGALFQIFLSAAAPVLPPSGTLEDLPANALANCRVLVLDDEDAVLDTMRQALSSAGAQVSTFSEPAEALAEIQQRRFDAILLDCTMPGGWSAARIYSWLRQQRPGMERFVILCSSNADDPEVSQFAVGNQLRCLPKPFSPKQLIETVRGHLDQMRTAASAGH
ncbi:MAG: PAS domain S-box protein, partial [Candidatus Korobacteraceae bacterium]